MNIALLGFGMQNRSAYDYYNKPENTITICVPNDPGNLPGGVATNIGENYLSELDRFDLLVRTPIINPNQITQSNPETPNILQKVTTPTNEFFKVCPAPIIGVTGTKGKGTTSTLIAKILQAAGHTVHLGGNIGVPPLDMLKKDIKPTDTVVLELASFQLVDLKYSPKIAVCVVVNQEHTDWHGDMYEYVLAKQQMFAHQKTDDLAIFDARSELSEQVVTPSPARKIGYEVPPVGEQPIEEESVFVEGDTIMAFGKHVCNTSDVALLGHHNLENVCAAIAATWDLVQGNTQIIKKVLQNFAGLPHRIEILGQKHDVWYINDSFAANPTATIAAIDAIDKHKVLIIGGFDRDLNLDELTQKIIQRSKDIRKVVLIGASSERVSEHLTTNKFTNFVISKAETMSEVVKEATAHAQKNDAVLLSPGFPSFDMFKNFEDRGLQFKECVKNL